MRVVRESGWVCCCCGNWDGYCKRVGVALEESTSSYGESISLISLFIARFFCERKCLFSIFFTDCEFLIYKLFKNELSIKISVWEFAVFPWRWWPLISRGRISRNCA